MNDRVRLTVEEVDALITPGEYVHTFMSAVGVLVGAEWERERILKAAAEWAELAGELATKLEHGVVIHSPCSGEPVFVSTKGGAHPKPHLTVCE